MRSIFRITFFCLWASLTVALSVAFAAQRSVGPAPGTPEYVQLENASLKVVNQRQQTELDMLRKQVQDLQSQLKSMPSTAPASPQNLDGSFFSSTFKRYRDSALASCKEVAGRLRISVTQPAAGMTTTTISCEF